jgi:HPt (histidine-containing phosphotransfer) domain-containing protein
LNEINPKTIKKTNDIEIIKKLPIIDIKKAMSNLRNDDVLFKQILELAIEDIPNYLNSLKHDFDKREPENIKQQAHKLKSSFQLIAAKRCEALVDLISHKSTKMEYESADIHALEREWDRLMQQVKQMIQGQKI